VDALLTVSNSETFICDRQDTETHRLGYQSWTKHNLCIDSFHGDIAYFTTRWDALCPYIAVNETMLQMAEKPLIVYALPPESPWGHPIRDAYGLVRVRERGYWDDGYRQRKFKKLRAKHQKYNHHIDCLPGSDLTRQQLLAWGGEHFSRYGILEKELDGFLDYVRYLELLVFQVKDPMGETVLTDVSVIMPERGQVYGSFCQWNPAFRNDSPGLYACLLAAQWTYEQGYETYNLGPVGDYPYKSLFVNDVEPIYSLAICPPEHALMRDAGSPLWADFEVSDWNRLERNQHTAWRASDYLQSLP
jgi:hypothetical protein